MATIEAMQQLMANMKRHFKFQGAGTEIEMAALFADYHAALECLDDSLIVTLWQQILTGHTSSFPPTPGQCLKLIAPYRETERLNRPEYDHPQLEHAPIPKAERELVGGRMTRWKNLMASGEFWRMSHSEAYDAVYGINAPPAHKRQILENIDCIRAKRPRSPTLALDFTPETAPDYQPPPKVDDATLDPALFG